MKFSVEWLKQHLETDASAEEIAKKLTAIGLEVESLSNVAEALAPFRVARVLTADKHPQADKLQVLLQPLERELHAPTPPDSVGTSSARKP